VVDDDDFQFQNLTIDTFVEPNMVDDDDSIFGVMISSEVSLWGLMKNILCRFCDRHVML
jgi:hypothetical protein